MLGVHKNLTRSFADAELARVLSAGPGSLDCRGTYRRPNGDRSVLPCRSHLRWVSKGWELIGLENEDSIRRQLGSGS